MKTKKKVTIEVFVPLGSCVCDFAPLMEKVGHVTSRFRDCVEIQMKSIKSPKASRYGVQDKCVVVAGKIRLSADFGENELEEAIQKECQL